MRWIDRVNMDSNRFSQESRISSLQNSLTGTYKRIPSQTTSVVYFNVLMILPTSLMKSLKCLQFIEEHYRGTQIIRMTHVDSGGDAFLNGSHFQGSRRYVSILQIASYRATRKTQRLGPDTAELCVFFMLLIDLSPFILRKM